MKIRNLFLILMIVGLFVVGCGDEESDDAVVTDDDDDTTDDDDDTTDDDDDDTTDDDDDTAPECEGEASPCKNNDECCPDFVCDLDSLTCETPACAAASECTGDEAYEWDCINQRCNPKPCLGSTECQAGYVCSAGVCSKAADCGSIASITIDQPDGLITGSATIQLSATAWNQNGAKIELTDAAPFTWSVDDDTVASVDTNGALTGGTTDGAVVVTAALTCNNALTDTINYTNFAAVGANDTRVVIFDENTGALLEGFSVAIDDLAPITTDASGIALFASKDCLTAACNVHAFDTNAEYSAISVLGVTSSDLLLPVVKKADTTVAAGFKTPMSFDDIPDAIAADNDIRLGIAVSSIPGNLVNVDFLTLIGELVETEISLGSINEVIPLPTGVELHLTETQIAGPAAVSGIPGTNTVWALGGYADLGDVIELVTTNMGGGEDIDIAGILTALMPLFGDFYHGIVPSLDFQAMDKVEDINDINGNDDTTDLVPDFDNFPALPGGQVLSLNQAQSNRVELTYGNVEVGSGVIALVGTMQTGVGFVPLGLGAGMDKTDSDDLGDGVIGDGGAISVPFAPQHSGLVGYDYYVLSIMANIDDLVAGGAINLSGVLTRSETSPTALSPTGFLPLLTNVTAGENTFGTDAVANANFVRVAAMLDGQQWHIYMPADDPNFDLSTLPTGMADIYDGSGLVIAAQLNGGVDYNGLFTFNGTNLNMLNDLVDAFVIYNLDEGSGDSGCSMVSGSEGSSAAMVMMGFLALLGLARIRKH